MITDVRFVPYSDGGLYAEHEVRPGALLQGVGTDGSGGALLDSCRYGAPVGPVFIGQPKPIQARSDFERYATDRARAAFLRRRSRSYPDSYPTRLHVIVCSFCKSLEQPVSDALYRSAFER